MWKYDVRRRIMIPTSRGSSRLGSIFTGPYDLKHLYFGSPLTAHIWKSIGFFFVFTMIATYLFLCCTCRSNNFHFAHSNSNAIVKTSRFLRLWYSQILAGSKCRRKSCPFVHTCSWYPALRMVVSQGNFYRPSVKRNVEYSCIFHNNWDLLFNSCQQGTNNTQNEYKYLTVFVLQKTSLTDFYKRHFDH